VNTWLFLGAAALLSVERIAYALIWRRADEFRAAWAEPVDALRGLFYAFKAIQIGVFLSWCYVYGNGRLWPSDADALTVAIGATFIVVGQILNASVFYRLGRHGVFYGDRFGYSIPWCTEFPFSLCSHPQYAGAVMSIWGLFLVLRFPHDDWYVLPLLETMYYFAGAHFER